MGVHIGKHAFINFSHNKIGMIICNCTEPKLDSYTIKSKEEVKLETIYHANMLGHVRSFIEIYANIDDSPLVLTIEGKITEK